MSKDAVFFYNNTRRTSNTWNTVNDQKNNNNNKKTIIMSDWMYCGSTNSEINGQSSIYKYEHIPVL